MEYVPPFGTTDPDGHYINGNPDIGQKGSIPPAEAFENPMREIVNVITKSGISPDAADLLQLTKAVRSQDLNYFVDTGAVNALAVTSDPPFVAGIDPGTPFRVKILAANTSTNVTLAVDSNPPYPVIRANGSVPDIGDFAAGQILDLIFDGTRFQVSNFSGFTSVSTNNNTYVVNIPYVADTSVSTNTVVAPFTPALTSLNAGDLVLVKIRNTNTAAVQIIVNALTAKQIIGVDGQQLVASQMAANMMALLAYDGAAFQLTNPAISRPLAGGNVTIAKRAFYQDRLKHTTTVKSIPGVEAFRLSYVPQGANNKIVVTMTGIAGSGTGAGAAGKRNVDAYMSWSSDGGSTWTNADSTLPAGFQANYLESAWETFSPIITERDETFVIQGQMIVPAGPPAELLFRLMYICASGITPDVSIWAGTTTHVIEYTG